MSVTIQEVLGDLRSTALDTRDQGDKFERLMHSYLRTDPEWTAKFSDVWLWSDWPERGNRPDTGIDLVAKNRDDDRYTAIQCKFYAADSTVAKKDIDSFLSASARDEFSQRYIFDTAKSWSKNATDTIEGMSVPVQRVDIGYLDEVNIDWSGYSWTTPGVLPTTGPKQLRPHQTRALEDVRKGLAEHDRGKLVMACGTGQDVHVAAHRRGPGRGGRQRAVPGAFDPADVAVAARVDGQPRDRHPAVRGLLRRPRRSQGQRRGRSVDDRSHRAGHHRCPHAGAPDGDADAVPSHA